MEREVVVTGTGLVSALAHSPEELFARIENGLSSVRVKPDQLLYGMPNTASAHIAPETWEIVERLLPSASQRTLGRAAKLAHFAARQALLESGVDLARVDRKGLFVASNRHSFTDEHLTKCQEFLDLKTRQFDLDGLIRSARQEGREYYRKRQDIAALFLSELYDIQDVVMAHADACAAGGVAIGTGYRYIRAGEVDLALVGGAEAMCDFTTLLAFSLLGALSQDAVDDPASISRPFDRSRGGFAMGEGAGFLVLESREHAEQRGARILAKVCGFAKLAEGYRITTSPPDGSEYARCMAAALESAGMSAANIDHVNAHGTSTSANDACESAAFHQIFGARAGQVPITANKSAVGHALGASGAIEAILSVLSLRSGKLLPTFNFCEPDAACAGLDIVTTTRVCPIRTVMSNSFGFGGENCTLIFAGDA